MSQNLFAHRNVIDNFSIKEQWLLDPDDQTGWWEVGEVWDFIRPFEGDDHEFALVSGDRESWERVSFQRHDPDEWGGHSGPAGHAFDNPTHVVAYPWLGWVEFSSGGLDV